MIVGEGASTYAEIALTDHRGDPVGYTQVDIEDLDHLLDSGRWCLLRMPGGVRYSHRVGREGEPATVLMHREVLARAQGTLRTPSWSDLPKGAERYVVDHIDGDGLDNRRSNLREITQSQNLRKSRKYKRRAPAQIGLPEGVRRESNRIVAIASIDRRGVSITRIDPADHPTEDHAIALAACIRQSVQEMIHGADAIGVDAEHVWRDLVSEDEAVRWAVRALETRARYSLEMRSRYEERLRALRGRLG
ncbi:MAG: HNH endonuclease [Myxococcota bacterium]|nr:HNH endonuclease [Myxococcota bacterium]